MKTVIVTGLSGAGKTQAMDCLEDLGYYCIDNMPPALIRNFLDLAGNEATPIEKAAFVVDVRGREFFAAMEKTLDYLEENKINYKILYLEAADQVLIRRFNETRRQHPLSKGESTIEGITRETAMLQTLRDQADFILDTSNMNNARLWQEVKAIFTSGNSEKTFAFNIMSFGYKRGVPMGADMIFDMRFIPNPYYVKTLKPLTGNNQRVKEYVLRHEEVQDFLQMLDKMLKELVPLYMREGKYSLNLAFGCTGGHHRSVAVANEMGRILKEQGKRIVIEHRDL